jgi:hypothetical protein
MRVKREYEARKAILDRYRKICAQDGLSGIQAKLEELLK